MRTANASAPSRRSVSSEFRRHGRTKTPERQQSSVGVAAVKDGVHVDVALHAEDASPDYDLYVMVFETPDHWKR